MNHVLLLLFGMAIESNTQHMTLCDYFEKLGLAKPECGHMIKPPIQNDFATSPMAFNAYNNNFGNINNNNNQNSIRFSSFNNVPALQFNSFSSNLGALPLCRSYFHSCMSSTSCESGTVCTNGLEQGACCTNPHRSNCPSATSMNINCRKTRSVNWCNTDNDCRGASTTASMCCPTGCNYNMCVHVGHQIYHPRRSIVFKSLSPQSIGSSSTSTSTEEECPDPYLIDIKCISQKGANWCYTDNECRSGMYTRKCCATNCGYNTCVMKFNNKWIIA